MTPDSTILTTLFSCAMAKLKLRPHLIGHRILTNLASHLSMESKTITIFGISKNRILSLSSVNTSLMRCHRVSRRLSHISSDVIKCSIAILYSSCNRVMTINQNVSASVQNGVEFCRIRIGQIILKTATALSKKSPCSTQIDTYPGGKHHFI